MKFLIAPAMLALLTTAPAMAVSVPAPAAERQASAPLIQVRNDDGWRRGPPPGRWHGGPPGWRSSYYGRPYYGPPPRYWRPPPRYYYPPPPPVYYAPPPPPIYYPGPSVGFYFGF